MNKIFISVALFGSTFNSNSRSQNINTNRKHLTMEDRWKKEKLLHFALQSQSTSTQNVHCNNLFGILSKVKLIRSMLVHFRHGPRFTIVPQVKVDLNFEG